MSDAHAILAAKVGALSRRAQASLQTIIDLVLEIRTPAILQVDAARRHQRYAALLAQAGGAEDDPAVRFKKLFDAVPAGDRLILQTLIDLAVDMARPGILQVEAERQRLLANASCAGTYRFNVGPLGTVDDLHVQLDDNLLRILGEFYLGDLPSDAVRAEISVALYRGDDKGGAGR